MFLIIFFIILGYVFYLWYANTKSNYKKYLPELEIGKDPETNKEIDKGKLLKIAKKINSNGSLTDEESKTLLSAYGMNSDDYKIEEAEKHNSTKYSSTNEIPVSGETKIRQNADGYVYFSKLYQKDPDHLYKVIDYSWGGPRYETTYSTTTTSKNKHLVPIINQKRTGTSKTTSTTTAHATLCQLLLIDMNTNDKILSEANIDSEQNKVISRFKIWADTSNQHKAENVMNSNNSSDNAEKLRQLKSLLDDGILTQEEFDAKKKQILGI